MTGPTGPSTPAEPFPAPPGGPQHDTDGDGEYVGRHRAPEEPEEQR